MPTIQGMDSLLNFRKEKKMTRFFGFALAGQYVRWGLQNFENCPYPRGRGKNGNGINSLPQSVTQGDDRGNREAVWDYR